MAFEEKRKCIFSLLRQFTSDYNFEVCTLQRVVVHYPFCIFFLLTDWQSYWPGCGVLVISVAAYENFLILTEHLVLLGTAQMLHCCYMRSRFKAKDPKGGIAISNNVM